MIISDFPRFTEIDLAHIDLVQGHLSRYPLEASEYTFTNMFSFRDAYDFHLSLLNGNIIILKKAEPVSLFCPIGNRDISEVLDQVLNYLGQFCKDPFLERIPESFVKKYVTGSEGLVAEEERDHFDYLYNTQELIELRGRKFHHKKNKVNKFRSTHEYVYETLTPDMIEECLEFENYWCEVRECEKYYGLHRERCAILEMLKNFHTLGLTGGVIRVQNRIAALTLGEKILPDTFVVHIEKAHSDMSGLYQVINQEFLRHEAGDCQFVNREQDLGIQGLRNSKMSYNPVMFVKKYKVRKKGDE